MYGEFTLQKCLKTRKETELGDGVTKTGQFGHPTFGTWRIRQTPSDSITLALVLYLEYCSLQWSERKFGYR